MPTPLTLELDPAHSVHRVLGSDQSAQFCGYKSTAHWRRLHQAGKVPKAVRINGGRLGWRIADLIKFNQSRNGEA